MKFLHFCCCVCITCLLVSCNKNNNLFSRISSDESNIHFNNLITENDTLNPIDVTNIYNGGGVGIGDFNNDGLQDIYFTGNVVSNKLYLNQGHFKFQDVTEQAGVKGEGKWCRGVAVVDINNDGLLDMYVCVSMSKNARDRENILYVNEGIDKAGVPHFKNMAEAYGLNDTTHSTMATFFDYDNDGDLDMYLVVNEILKNDNPGSFRPIITDGSHPSTGRLYRNEWSAALKHPVFTNVSKQAGITIEGYGHGVNICDINRDGWKDIFVTNDFNSNDLLYINNHDGTFSNKASAYFKHTSANGMGQDVIDINNDGLADVVELDMNPQDNYRKKMMMSANSYQNYKNTEYFGYQYQYVRNTLQINQGPRVNQKDSIGDPIFSDVGFLSGIAETDWSWTPLVQDFDNDGLRDIIITNGFPRDVTDHDFIAFRQQSFKVASKEYSLSQVPEVKLHNYAFKNNGDLTFSDVSANWGMSTPTFSNGAAYVDLDNDGDLDFVVNNINDEASIYKNNEREQNKDSSHYLQIKLAGDNLNIEGLGAWVEIHYDHGKQQVWENTPYRGYLSTVQDIGHFGLGNVKTVDSVIIKWQNGKTQLLQHINADQLLQVNIATAVPGTPNSKAIFATNNLFKEVTDSVGIHYVHQQNDFVDFNIQKLLPHKLSEYGPALAVGDIDGNGLDDMISGGAAGYSAQLFLQQAENKFTQKPLLPAAAGKATDDMGLLLFDADGDGDQDFYIAGGGYRNQPGSPAYQDKLYVNDGKGNYTIDSLALPNNLTSKFCVRAIDYDKDGDLDLFIAGRVDPWNYPKPVSSFIYRNDSKDGHIKFTDVTNEAAKDLKNIGLVCDAVFTDFDNDGWPDLILAGEWMPITFFKNDKGVFKNITGASGINNQVGWWNTIVPGDFDNDGDIDYIVGNVGQNSLYKASDQYPVSIYAKDFDNNGSYDAFPSLYLPTSQMDQTKREYPAQTRDDIVKQMIGMRSKFQNYKSFAAATIDQLFTKEQLKDALILKANNFKSSYIRNDGNNKFTLLPLPAQAQISVLNGMTVDDFDGDGNLDVLINGNDYGTEVSVGRYDALNGLLLKGNGKGNFIAQSILESGIYIPGNGKALVKLRSGNGRYLIAATQNRGPLKMFELKRNINCIPLQTNDASALIKYKNGVSQKQEFYYGCSFLSQSARFLSIGSNVVSVTIYDNKGVARKINL
jgi:hypothetical protein